MDDAAIAAVFAAEDAAAVKQYTVTYYVAAAKEAWDARDPHLPFPADDITQEVLACASLYELAAEEEEGPRHHPELRIFDRIINGTYWDDDDEVADDGDGADLAADGDDAGAGANLAADGDGALQCGVLMQGSYLAYLRRSGRPNNPGRVAWWWRGASRPGSPDMQDPNLSVEIRATIALGEQERRAILATLLRL